MKLKTLLDFDIHPCGGNHCHSDDENSLRREAIKWIKHIKQDIKKVQKLEGKPQSALQNQVIRRLPEILEGQIIWIKIFFNITDEELI